MTQEIRAKEYIRDLSILSKLTGISKKIFANGQQNVEIANVSVSCELGISYYTVSRQVQRPSKLPRDTDTTVASTIDIIFSGTENILSMLVVK